MKKQRTLLIIVLPILFSILFYPDGVGINWSIFFSLTVLIGNFLFKPNWKGSLLLKVNLFSFVLSTCMLFVWNSDFAFIMSLFSWIFLIGNMHQDGIRSVYLAFFQSLNSFFYIPLREIDFGDNRFGRGVKALINLFFKWRVTLVLVGAFGFIFLLANVPFQEMMGRVFSQFFDFLEKIVKMIDMKRMLLLALGFILSKWFIFRGPRRKIIDWEMSLKDTLERLKKVRQAKVYHSPTILRQKLQTYTVSFVALNILLLVINALDVRYIWLEDTFKNVYSMSAKVHEGVFLLIVSILLAGAVIGYVFQGNLNFIRNNHKLKTATILWIAQNVFLLSSVAVRNQYYVQELGLTYKRIGVFIFLTIVFVGLIWLLMKVVKTKSFFFLARMNSISVLLILSLSTAVPWDQVIVDYNLKTKPIESVDMYYLLSLSPNVQPQLNELIYKNLRMKKDEKWLNYGRISDRKMDFIRYNLQETSWLTFNLADHNLRQKLAKY